MKIKDGFVHEKPNEGETNDWITPKWVIDAFDSTVKEGMFFDLDPCISQTQPWLTARNGYSIEQDGLKHNWWGTVYCNPPYGSNVGTWAKKMAEHNNGIMLIFARTETDVWQDFIFPYASGILFYNKRIMFYKPDGTPALNKKGKPASAGAPSAFIAFGNRANKTLKNLCLSGVISGAYTDNFVVTPSLTKGK